MRMANIKKVVAMLLALLMIFSSMSVIASAEDVTDGTEETEESLVFDAGTISVYTKLYRPVSGEYEEISNNGKVTPGESLVARVYVGTDFYTAGNDFLFYYDKEFFDVDYAAQTAITSGNTNYTAVAQANKASTLAAANPEDNEGIIRVNVEVAGNTCQKLSSENWLFQLDLKVASDADTADADAIGSLYLKEANLATPTNQGGLDTYSYNETSSYVYTDLKYSYQFNVITDYTDTDVTVNNTVTFKAGTEENADKQEVTGTIGKSYDVPAFEKEGYTLIAWQSETGAEIKAADTTFTMPLTTDVVYTAVWSTNVTVRFDTDGGSEIADIVGHYSGETWADDQKPDDPTKTVDGYTYEFKGWLDANNNLLDALPETYPAVSAGGDIYTYTAKWEKIVTVTYTSNGSEVTHFTGNEGTSWLDTTATPRYVLNSSTQEVSSAAGKLERTGYSFVGWDSNGDGKAEALPETYPSVNTTYVAIWEADKVQFKYYFDNTKSIQTNGTVDADVISSIMADSSKLLASKSETYGVAVTIPEITEGEYVITKWVDAEGKVYEAGKTYTFATANVVKLAASATETSENKNLTATFDAGEGVFADNTSVYTATGLSFGDLIDKPEDPTRTGYDFLGWEPEQDTMGAESMTFTAVWAEQEHEAIFMFGNGDKMQRITYYYGENVIAPDDPQKDGYEFLGWDGDNDGVADFTDDLTMGTEDLLFNAVWSVKKYTITYYNDTDKKVTLGSAPDEISYKDVITPMAQGKAVKEGYTHAGWVYYDANGTEYAEVIYNSGDTISINGGNRDDNDQLIMPAYDLEAIPTFEINSYKFTVVYDNDVDASTETQITYYSVIENEDDPVKEGYTFKGWKYTDEKGNVYATADENGTVTGGTQDTEGNLLMPAKAITATAQWDIDSYTLTFNFNGNGKEDKVYSIADNTAVRYGAKLEQYRPENPTWVGYTFNGWEYKDAVGTVYAKYVVVYAADGTATGHYEDSTGTQIADDSFTMPAYDLTATAQWTKNKYVLTYEITGDIQAKTETTEVEYGAEVKVAAIPTETGYTFNGGNGWNVTGLGDTVKTAEENYKFKMPANDVTLSGAFAINSYAVTYYITNAPYGESVSYDYNKTVDTVVPEEKEGYTFSGWNTSNLTSDGTETTVEPGKSFTMPASAVRFDGEYTINSYKLTTKIGSDTQDDPEDRDIVYNSALKDKLPATPTDRIGYTFKGWTITATDGGKEYATYDEESKSFTKAGSISSDITMPAYDLTFTAIWEKVEYTVKFYDDDPALDGKIIAADTITVKIGDTISVPQDPTKEGYEFADWANDMGIQSPAADTPVEVDATILENVAADNVITYYATWNVSNYSLTFNYMYTDEGVDQEVSYEVEGGVEYDQSINDEIPDADGYEGYTFVQWVITYEDGDNTVTYATISYDGDGNETISGGKQDEDGNLLMPAHDLTATAEYKINQYTITFDANTGAFSDAKTTKEITADYKSDVSAAIAAIVGDTLTKEGYTFLGWADTADAKSATYTKAEDFATTMPLDGAKYYAVWEINTWTITYKVDEKEYQTQTEVAFNSTNTLIAEPSKDGYTFSGWSSSDVAIENGKFTMPNKNITISGTFTAGSNTITYYSDKAEKGKKGYNTDAAIDKGIDVVKEGHTFAGWVYTDADNNVYGKYVVNADGTHFENATGTTVTELKMPAYNLTATAQWTVNSYKLTYNITGIDGKITSSSNTKPMDYGSSITVQTAPTKDGYTFSGWTVVGATPDAENKFTMPANDVTISGYWTANKYTITFDANTGKFSDSTATKKIENKDFDTDVSADIATIVANTLVKDGYTFAGWADTADAESAKYTKAADFAATMPLDGATYYAVWTAVDLKITFKWTDPTTSEEKTDVYGTGTNKYHIGDSFTVIKPTDYTGYKFDGWTTSDITGSEQTFTGTGTEKFTMPGKDVTLVGTYSPITYTVNYAFYENDVIMDGKTITKRYKIGDTLSTIETAREGYTVYAWFTDSTVTNEIKLGDADGKFCAADITNYFGTGTEITINCYYSINHVTLHYYTKINNGKIDIEKVKYGTALSEIEESDNRLTGLTKEGYKFSGWKYYTDLARTEEYLYTGTTVPDGQLYANAQWTAETYTITFNANGGYFGSEKTSLVTAAYDSNIETQIASVNDNPPTRTGYEFLGWADTDSATAANVDLSTIKTMGLSKEYFAVWQKESYTVTFMADGKEIDGSPITYTYGDTVSVPTATKQGYEFKYWYDANGNEYSITDANNMVKDLGENGAKITLTAYFTAANGNVSFMKNDGTSTEFYHTVLKTGERINAPETNPTRTGYTFEGWAKTSTATADDKVNFVDNEVLMPATGVTYYAIWSANDIKIVFNAGDGKFEDGTNEITNITAKYDSALKDTADAVEKPTKEGYTFEGWSRYQNQTAADADLGKVNDTESINLYAAWSKNSYDLVIDPANGNAKAEYTAANNNAVGYNELIDTKISTVTKGKDGYKFLGWDTDGDKETVEYAASASNIRMPAKALTLTAVYEAQPQTIIFNAGDGKFESGEGVSSDGKTITKEINTDEPITVPDKNPTRDGYTFAGWDYDGDGNVDDISEKTVPANGKEIKAVWTTGSTKFKVEYYYADVNNSYSDTADSFVEPTAESDATIDIRKYVTIPSKDGYEIDTDLVKEETYTIKVDSVNETVVKIYFKRSTYDLTFDANGGYFGSDTTATADKVEKVIYGSSLTAPTVDRTGYTFDGWEYNTKIYSAEDIAKMTMPEYPITFTAKWTAAPFTVRYVFNDKLIYSDSATYDKTYTVRSVTEGEYEITKWTIEGTQLTYNAGESFTYTYDKVITLVGDASTEPSGNYTATFNPDGGTFADTKLVDASGNYVITGLKTGDTITEPAAPTKAGYTFNGWDSPVGTMGTENVTFTAIWNANNITVKYYDDDATTTFKDDDGNDLTTEITVGKEIEVTDVSKDGYVFANWTFTYYDKDGKELRKDTVFGEEGEITPAIDAAYVKAVVTWENNSFKVTFDPNGGTIEGVTGNYTVSLKYGALISGAAPVEAGIASSNKKISKDNHVLAGWDSDGNTNTIEYTAEFKAIKGGPDATMGSEDVTYTAVWAKSTYIVNYYVGETKVNTASAYHLDSYKVVSVDYADNTYSKWTYNGTEYKAGDTISGIASSVTSINLYAVEDTYTATFVPNGGTFKDIDESKLVDGNYVITGLKTGDPITAPTVEKVGYTLSWSDPVGTMGYESVIYEAQWTGKEIPVTYYLADGTTKDSEGNVQVGEAIEIPDLSIEDEVLDYWEIFYTDENGETKSVKVTGEEEDGVVMPATDDTSLKAVAHYVATYTVTYDPNGGAFAEGTELTGDYVVVKGLKEGSDYKSSAPTGLTKDNATFSGWDYYTVDASGNVSTTAYTGTTMPASNLRAVAKYTDASKKVVKLMPAEGNETVMIERGNGAVETYCTTTIEGFNKYSSAARRRAYAPHGVKSVDKAYSDEYDKYGKYTVTDGDYSTWFVYGLAEGIKVEELAAYMEVVGDGYYEVSNLRGRKITSGTIATGYSIAVYDAEGVFVEKFYIVIFGDINRDGYINGSDSKAIDDEIRYKTTWSNSATKSYSPCLVRAANVNGDEYILSTDAKVIDDYSRLKVKINQTTGRP